MRLKEPRSTWRKGGNPKLVRIASRWNLSPAYEVYVRVFETVAHGQPCRDCKSATAMVGEVEGVPPPVVVGKAASWSAS